VFEDKRDYTRFNASVTPICCEKGECQNISIMVKDVSGSGIGILTNERLSCGDKIKLELRIPQDDIPLFVTGEVAWVLRHKNVENVYNAGVKWVKMNRVDKSRLINYLSDSFPK
jgi:Tfp pilus assembly protein PilZ